MQCPTPISIVDQSFNNPYKKASQRISVPCGKCGICKTNRRNMWAFRLKQELKHSENAYFITLTYSDDKIPETEPDENGEIHQTLCKDDLTKFLKRLRENEYRKTGHRKIRYYAVGEYGTETDRPHYHLILFNLSRYSADRLTSIWSKGHTHLGSVTEASIYYVSKYHVNRNPDENEYRTKEFATMSRRPAIGHQYIQTHASYHADFTRNFVIDNGHKLTMPRYYRQKIFDEGQRYLQNQTAMVKQDQDYHKEIERLTRLSVSEPHHYIFKKAIHLAQKYKRKSKENNII